MDTEQITLINVFEIRQDDIEMFLQEWQERAQFMGTQRGFQFVNVAE
jgi:heme-degrading monooxygenase HmoA